MEATGVKMTLLMPPLSRAGRAGAIDLDRLLAIAAENPRRIAVMGGGASLNPMIDGAPEAGPVGNDLKREFQETAEAILAKGAVGFGEMTALHFSFFARHPFEETRPDHPLFLLLADIAARHDAPIDLHMEAVSEETATPEFAVARSAANPARVAENIGAFERLLAHDRNARIVWVHLGMDTTTHRTVALTRRLLAAHPNLYLSVTGIQDDLRGAPAAATGDWFFRPDEGLNPRWRELIVAFSDRFMIGSDGFYLPPGADFRMPQFTERAAAVINELPPEIGRKVAHENATRVYKLGPAQRRL